MPAAALPPTSVPSAPPAVQRCQPAARRQRQHEPGGPQQGIDPRARVGQRVVFVNQPAGVPQQQREQVCRSAEQEQEEARQPRTDGADPVGDGPRLTGVGETRIRVVETRECEEQQYSERAERPERALTQAAGNCGRQLRLGLRTAVRALAG